MTPNRWFILACLTCFTIVVIVYSYHNRAVVGDDALNAAQSQVASANGDLEKMLRGVQVAEEHLLLDSRNAQALFIAGWGRQLRGELDEAQILYQRLFRELTEFGSYGYHNSGIIFESRGALDTALDYYLRSTQFDQNFVGGWFGAAKMLVRLQRIEEARELLQGALVLNPNDSRLTEMLKNLPPA